MKKSKKLIAIILGITMIISLSACSKTSSATDATKFMDEFINTFKTGDFTKANAMTQDPNFLYFEVAENPTFTVASQESAIEMMKQLEYKYLNETTTGETTTLEIEFTVKNVGELFITGMRAAVMKNLETTEAGLSDEEVIAQVGQAFEEAFNKKPATHKEIITVDLKKTDSGYEIVPTGNLLNMLMGNLLRSQEELSQALAGVS